MEDELDGMFEGVLAGFDELELETQATGIEAQLVGAIDGDSEDVVEDSGDTAMYVAGQNIEAIWYDDGFWYRAKVKEVLDGCIHVIFTDYGNDQMTALKDIRPPTEPERRNDAEVLTKQGEDEGNAGDGGDADTDAEAASSPDTTPASTEGPTSEPSKASVLTQARALRSGEDDANDDDDDDDDGDFVVQRSGQSDSALSATKKKAPALPPRRSSHELGRQRNVRDRTSTMLSDRSTGFRAPRSRPGRHATVLVADRKALSRESTPLLIAVMGAEATGKSTLIASVSDSHASHIPGPQMVRDETVSRGVMLMELPVGHDTSDSLPLVHGALVLFSLASAVSLQACRAFITQITSKKKPWVLVGTHADDTLMRKVPSSMGQALAQGEPLCKGYCEVDCTDVGSIRTAYMHLVPPEAVVGNAAAPSSPGVGGKGKRGRQGTQTLRIATMLPMPRDNTDTALLALVDRLRSTDSGVVMELRKRSAKGKKMKKAAYSSFVAAEAVGWISSNTGRSRMEALKVMQELAASDLVYMVNNEKSFGTPVFLDTTDLWRFLQDDKTPPLNIDGHIAKAKPCPLDPLDVAELLLEQMLALVRNHLCVTATGVGVDWERIRRQPDYATFRIRTSSLCKLNMAKVTDAQAKIAFWLNVYNCMSLHAIALTGQRPLSAKDSFFTSTVYLIDRQRLSLHDVLHGILRANSKTNPLGTAPLTEPQSAKYSVRKVDPRVWFALQWASVGSGLAQIYHADTLDEQLTHATRFYLDQHVGYNLAKNVVTLPAMFRDGRGDFGGKDPNAWLLKYVDEEKRQTLAYLFKEGADVKYVDHSWHHLPPRIE